MKVQVKKMGGQYNQFGCGYRLLFLIIYKNKRKYSIMGFSNYLNKRLNKLVEYWNFYGNSNGRDKIRKTTIYVPIDSLGETNEKDYTAIETESYGYKKPEYLSRRNLYHKEKGEI